MAESETKMCNFETELQISTKLGTGAADNVKLEMFAPWVSELLFLKSKTVLSPCAEIVLYLCP